MQHLLFKIVDKVATALLLVGGLYILLVPFFLLSDLLKLLLAGILDSLQLIFKKVAKVLSPLFLLTANELC